MTREVDPAVIIIPALLLAFAGLVSVGVVGFVLGVGLGLVLGGSTAWVLSLQHRIESLEACLEEETAD